MQNLYRVNVKRFRKKFKIRQSEFENWTEIFFVADEFRFVNVEFFF